MGLMFVGSKFCPHCGVAAAVVTQGPTEPHACPRCANSQLESVTVGSVALEECAGCGGLWVAAETFAKICADREAQESVVDIKLPPPVAETSGVHYLKCPQCAQLMNRLNFAGRSGVVIDQCKRHGIWFDRDELRRIIEFIRAGGLTVIRQNQIDELKHQRAMLEAERGDPDRSADSTIFARNYDEDTTTAVLGGVASVLASFLKK